jgi:hypothetical protein
MPGNAATRTTGRVGVRLYALALGRRVACWFPWKSRFLCFVGNDVSQNIPIEIEWHGPRRAYHSMPYFVRRYVRRLKVNGYAVVKITRRRGDAT